jgi:glycosyltransferase involved in cell wall biosynthesis
LKREGIHSILTDHWWPILEPEQLSCWNRGLGWLAGGACRWIGRRLNIDPGIGWSRAAEQACSTLRAKDVDIILATGGPFVTFRLAKRLSDRLGCPYILDYRDPWTGNPHADGPASPNTIQEEARLLADCAAVTTVSHSLAVVLDSRFGLGSKLHIVTNGYNPEELVHVRPHNFGHFAIVYAGNFYLPKRVISPVLAVLKRLKETMNGTGGQWYFHYYGRQEDHVREEAQRFGVMERVVLHGSVPRAEALSAVRGAAVAVVITSVTTETTLEDLGIVPAKLFETLGLGTPILLIAPSGSDIESIVETTGLACCFAGSNNDGMVSFLVNMMHGWAPQLKDREMYAWPNIVRKMDFILRASMQQCEPYTRQIR